MRGAVTCADEAVLVGGCGSLATAPGKMDRQNW